MNNPPLSSPGPKSGRAPRQTAEQFIETEILSEIAAGRGFVPLIGAGFSAPSGIPILWDMHRYLQECIAMALGLARKDSVGVRPWNPRKDNWPPIEQMDRSEPHEAGGRFDIFSKEVHSLLKKARSIRASEERDEQETRDALAKLEKRRDLVQEGAGSISEWRSALLFLSRIVVVDGGPEAPATECELALAAPDQSVIDACFNEVLARRHPMLCHRMLGILAGALRLNVLLTTNFDDLLEIAFLEAKNPLSVYAVQVGSTLPPHMPVVGERMLIKLHGDRRSLRADYSLDARPSDEDLWNFMSYFATPDGRNTIAERTRKKDPIARIPSEKSLLVFGHSLEEPRTVELIKHAFEHLDGSFKVLTVCFSNKDFETLAKLRRRLPYGRSRFRFFRYPQTGLFLLQLFQSLRHSLPSWGIIFPSTSRLALPPLKDVNESKDEADEQLKKIEKRLSGVTPWRWLIVCARRRLHGATSICGRLFEKSQRDGVCLWIDMNHIGSTMDLFEKVLDAFHYQSGRETWKPTRVGFRDIDDAAQILAEEVYASGKPWILFINARERPGANFEAGGQKSSPNGWLDHPEHRKPSPGPFGSQDLHDRTDTRRQFIMLWSKAWRHLAALLRSKPLSGKCSLRVVLLCVGGRKSPLIRESIEAWNRPPKKGKRVIRGVAHQVTQSASSVSGGDPLTVGKRAVDRVRRDPQRKRFLHALTLMQRPRYPAVVWNQAVRGLFPDQGAYRPDAWLKRLESWGLLARKPGGFIWLRAGFRIPLRSVFEDSAEGREESVRIHRALVDWYERVLAASEAPSAVFEAVYHALAAARLVLARDPKDLLDNEVEAAHLIDRAKELLKNHSFLIQTLGYAFANFRILGRFLDDDDQAEKRELGPAFSRLPPRVQNSFCGFQVQCAENARTIARELGEYELAYEMHATVARLRCKLTGTVVAGKAMDQIASYASKSSDGATCIHWWRWSCMLALASRSYRFAPRIVGYCRSNLRSYPRSITSVLHELSQNLSRCRLKKSRYSVAFVPAHRAKIEIQVLKLIEEVIACEVERLQGLVLSKKDSVLRDQDKVPSSNHTEDLVDRIARCLELGEDFAKSLQGESVDRSTIHWCLSRFHMYRSAWVTLKAGIEKDPAHPGWASAMALLNEANSCLQSSLAAREAFDRAVVEMFRADAKLRHAECTLRADPEALAGANITNKGAVASALVEDGVHFLVRAERVLARRRRNVWWSTWYFERMLKAIALSVEIAGISRQPEDPIPYFGMAVLAEGKISLADELLDDACRMIRADTFRLATIIDAYGACLQALLNRKWRDQRLNKVRADMAERITKALKRLEATKTTRETREGISQKSAFIRSKPDPFIGEYVARINRRVGRICRQRTV